VSRTTTGSLRVLTRPITVALGHLSPVTRVMSFAGGLVVMGLALVALTPSPLTAPEREWSMPFMAMVVAFGLAEAAALHVEIRKESHSLSLSLIPLMFGTLYLSPLTLASAYMLGGMPVLFWIRKLNLVKTVWNGCLFWAEAALAALIVKSVLGDDIPDNVFEWMVPLAAVLSAELLSLFAVSLVIMAVDAKFRPNLFSDVGRSQILAALAGSFTVTAVAASIGSPFVLVFAFVPVLGIGALLRTTGHLSQRFQDLQQLHGFTRALTNERGSRTLDTGLVTLVEIMRSNTAGLLVDSPDEDSAARIRLLVDDILEDRDGGSAAESMLRVVPPGAVTQLTEDDFDPTIRALLRYLGAGRVLAARVLAEVGRDGVLFVADRLGMRAEFNADEIRLFASLADTLSARLSNDHLVEQLEVQAQHDALTGLPNRLNFEIALTSLLADPEQTGVIVMVDLDRFKEINDSLGHETGDRLLIEVGRRLRSSTRSTDMVSRFGGDEFAVLLTGRNADGPADFTRRISDAHARLVEKVELEGITFEIGASFGVVQWPDQGTDSASLLHRADTAMYEAKRNQLGVTWYTPELDADAPRRLDLYMSARSALENEDLYIHLQPKVAVSDGRITGAEALVRWTHPAHGNIPPLEFVPLIEQAGLIGKLTRLVIRLAVEAAATLRETGLDIPIAVNLTPRDLLDPMLPAEIERMLAVNGVEPSSLQVEVTEGSMVVDFDASVDVLARIRALGVLIAIDDFGTGYSSLQHLHRLPVDQLKIDRSFVSRLATDDSAIAIVRSSINLARDLGLTTVAEGIEDDRSLQFVAGLGCQEAQGFLMGRPVPVLELLGWALEWENTGRHRFVGSIPPGPHRLPVTPGERPLGDGGTRRGPSNPADPRLTLGHAGPTKRG
jgi:diguanylate cyclase (GGDEF)-like protein